MIIGFLSIILDFSFLYFFNYYVGNTIVFPMFSLIFLLSLLFFNYNKKIFLLFFLLNSFICGIIFLPLLICFLFFIIDKKINKNNYLLLICISIITYDIFFFLLLSISDIRLLIDKIIISIPINMVYSLFLYNYFVLINKKSKYKLV